MSLFGIGGRRGSFRASTAWISRACRTAAAAVVLAAVALAGAAPASAAVLAPTTNARDLADAMAAQTDLVTAASFAAGPSGNSANGTGGVVGNFFPTDGPTFAALTTGDVANADPPNNTGSKSTSNGTSARNVNDLTILKVDVNVPAGANCIGFDGVFYSEEFREFIGSQFNDAFVAELDGNDWTYSSATNTVTAPRNFAFDTNGRQLTVNTALVSSDDTGLQYDGSTVLLRARTPVTAGVHSLYFTIFDAGDRIYDSAMFIDNLRVGNVPAAQCTAGATPADTDGDGIRDEWETDGVDVDGDGTVDLDLPAMGADSQHKDLFVEVDWMSPHQLGQEAIDTVVNSFAAAPVTNPDGNNGVTLHVDAGRNSVMNPATGDTWGDRSQANSIPHRNVLGSFDASTPPNYIWTAFDTRKSANFSSDREPVFRYALSVHRYGGATQDSSGIARGMPSSDLIVALGRTDGGVHHTFTAGDRAGTFMHEFGHTLGLWHGGNANVNWKPNYLSIMNYSWQFAGLSHTTTNPAYDYSRFGSTSAAGTVGTLDESSLSEDTGLTATGDAANYQLLHFCNGDGAGATPQGPFNMNTAVDWNCSAPTSGTVSTSVNKGTDMETLAPHDDWAVVRYKGGAVGGLGLDQTLPQTSEVLDTATIAELQKAARVVRGDARRPRVRIGSVRRRGRALRRLEVRARDNKGLERLIVTVKRKRKGKRVTTTKTILPKKPCLKRKRRTGKCLKKARSRSRRQKALTYTVRLKRGKNTVRAIAFDQASNRSKVARKSRRR